MENVGRQIEKYKEDRSDKNGGRKEKESGNKRVNVKRKIGLIKKEYKREWKEKGKWKEGNNEKKNKKNKIGLMKMQ